MISCEGSFDPTEPEGQVTLTFPANAQVCPEGELLGNNQIKVNLLWNSDTNFNNYRITITNPEGVDLISEIEASKNDTEITLERNTLYTWFVSGLRGKEVIPSEVWSFYTQGNPTANHIPYPALVQTITNGENVIISWVGKDEDINDTLSFDLLVSTENPPETVVLADTNTTEYSDSFTIGVTYYIMITTKDNLGGFSNSQIISFTP
jgi:hypothetical protein